MRTARLVGLSPDGRSLIVATDRGEELTLAADDRLRAAVRGDRPRLGQLEIQMDSSLSPRDIQSRIRSGASLEDVARVAGLPLERVERFAAPVLAERDHIAATAMSSSVRRRGETSAHRNLRVTVTERLHDRGVDIDTIDWDSSRREDGRWSVTADYQVDDEPRHAEFWYDLQGRFSVAGNDEAKWLLGEQPPTRGAEAAGPSAESPAEEDDLGDRPGLDRDDELALVRATRETPAAGEHATGRAEAGQGEDGQAEDEQAEDGQADDGQADDGQADDGQADAAPVDDTQPHDAQVDEEAPPAVPAAGPTAAAVRTPAQEAAEPTVAIVRRLTAVEVTEVVVEDADVAGRSDLDTLYAMLGRDGYAEDSARVYPGLSDASAVPVVDDHDFEPAPVAAGFPVEPGEDETALPAEDDTAPAVRPSAAESGSPGTDTTPAEPVPDLPAAQAGPVGDEPGAGPAPVVDETSPVMDDDLDDGALLPGPVPAPKPVKRKRASVPSWDEIMFGGPKNS